MNNTYAQKYDNDLIGIEMHDLIRELYPLCRSITGDGVRETLRILENYIPLQTHNVPTGTPVFDWTVPKEWNIREAYVKNAKGEKIIDFKVSNLHVLNYSIPVNKKVSLSELKRHLYTLPDYPEWIPYQTSYYHENWGFCISYNELQILEEGEYEVYIDSTLENGYLTYGEYYLPGESEKEILFSTHICHPSLCNDNLSGIAVATFLAEHIESLPRRYSYRFLFIPGTIGSITWLCLNEERTTRINSGLVLSGIGDKGNLNYKKSRRGNADIDKVVIHILSRTQQDYTIEEFSPYGYDERQYCSPGFNLPIGLLSRTPYGQYPEYHASADNLEFVKPIALAGSLAACIAIIETLEHNRKYKRTNPYCEPQLGKRGLIGSLGGKRATRDEEIAMLWVLNLSDGMHNLLDIAERSGMKFQLIYDVAVTLLQNNLLIECLESTLK